MGALAELMLVIWVGVVQALVCYVVMVLMTAFFDLEIVACGKDGSTR
jgi:phosphotransferase system  glucose/maltose/N-acetylglucosamine-specific IIC component